MRYVFFYIPFFKKKYYWACNLTLQSLSILICKMDTVIPLQWWNQQCLALHLILKNAIRCDIFVVDMSSVLWVWIVDPVKVDESLGWYFWAWLKCQSSILRHIIPLSYFLRKIKLLFNKRINFKTCSIKKST